MKRILLSAFIFSSFSLYAQVRGIRHIILIGVDGMGANYLHDAQIPVMTSMMQAGAYTLHARCVSPSSSADNWASMFMGAGPELHGYTEWNSSKPEIPSRELDHYGIFPTIYALLHDQDPKAHISMIYDWQGIGYLFPAQAVNDNIFLQSDSMVAATAVQLIKEKKPTLMLAYFSEVDGAGHGIGWGTPAYLRAIERTDRHIGEILQAVKDAGIADQTVVIVSADHGGINKGHGGKTLNEMEIPWIIYGRNVQKGRELTSSIMTYDTAATIAWILGLRTPQSWIGRPVRTAF